MDSSAIQKISRPPQLTSQARGTYRDDHGTPDWVLDLHRSIHGPTIHQDLASNPQAQLKIQAEAFYTEDVPCPRYLNTLPGEVVWCNPPGPARKVREFWDIWCHCMSQGSRGSFLLFSVDHMRLLQKLPPRPVFVGFLRKRLTFEGNTNSAAIGSALVTTHAPLMISDLELATWLIWGT